MKEGLGWGRWEIKSVQIDRDKMDIWDRSDKGRQIDILHVFQRYKRQYL